MALRNIFKRKKQPPSPPAPDKDLADEEKKEVKKTIEKPTEKPEVKEKRSAKRKKTKGGLSYLILKEPHITEKTTALAKKNQYVFKVYPRTNKIEIKKAVEKLYGVDVLAVRIINIPRKKRVLGRRSGWRKGYKKALIKVREGQKIDVLPRG